MPLLWASGQYLNMNDGSQVAVVYNGMAFGVLEYILPYHIHLKITVCTSELSFRLQKLMLNFHTPLITHFAAYNISEAEGHKVLIDL